MKSSIVKKITKLREKYGSDEEALKRCVEVQSRLRKIVETHGEAVACAATGYTEKTLRHHIACKKPRYISEQRVNIAEKIITELNL